MSTNWLNDRSELSAHPANGMQAGGCASGITAALEHVTARPLSPAICRSARAGTNAPVRTVHPARSRGRTCPTGGSGRAAPASSSRRPIARSGRLPDRHSPSRSASAGSWGRSGAQAYSGTRQPSRGLPGPEGDRRRRPGFGPMPTMLTACSIPGQLQGHSAQEIAIAALK
jgi:hypothetical protein